MDRQAPPRPDEHPVTTRRVSLGRASLIDLGIAVAVFAGAIWFAAHLGWL